MPAMTDATPHWTPTRAVGTGFVGPRAWVHHPARVCMMLVLSLATRSSAHAQGMPVIDTAVLAQTMQQLRQTMSQTQAQLQSLQTLRAQLQASSGHRGLGMAAYDRRLNDAIAPQAYRLFSAGSSAAVNAPLNIGLRWAGLSGTCQEPRSPQQAPCQTKLARAYIAVAIWQAAMDRSSGRLAQIERLMASANATQDLKGAAELQARATLEVALIGHERMQAQLLLGWLGAQDSLDRARQQARLETTMSQALRVAQFLR